MTFNKWHLVSVSFFSTLLHVTEKSCRKDAALYFFHTLRILKCNHCFAILSALFINHKGLLASLQLQTIAQQHT
jgi:hypothetical protein